MPIKTYEGKKGKGTKGVENKVKTKGIENKAKTKYTKGVDNKPKIPKKNKNKNKKNKDKFKEHQNYQNNYAKKARATEWDSGLNIIQKPKITVDLKLLLICNEIQGKFPAKEFSILAKGYDTPSGYMVSADYVIPKQQVTGSTVDYEPLDKYQQEGYNVVIHSHHNMGTFFSATDRDYINCQFPISILYTKDGLTLACISFQRGDNVFLFETKDIELSSDSVQVVGIENIEERTYRYQAKTAVKKVPAEKGWNAPTSKKKKNFGELSEGLQKLSEEKESKTASSREGPVQTIDCPSCNYFSTEWCRQCYIYEYEKANGTGWNDGNDYPEGDYEDDKDFEVPDEFRQAVCIGTNETEGCPYIGNEAGFCKVCYNAYMEHEAEMEGEVESDGESFPVGGEDSASAYDPESEKCKACTYKEVNPKICEKCRPMEQ